MGWVAVAHWLAGSLVMLAAVVTASVSMGDATVFGWLISFLLVTVGGLFWITAARSQFGRRRD